MSARSQLVTHEYRLTFAFLLESSGVSLTSRNGPRRNRDEKTSTRTTYRAQDTQVSTKLSCNGTIPAEHSTSSRRGATAKRFPRKVVLGTNFGE